jgi:hypothetical protein
MFFRRREMTAAGIFARSNHPRFDLHSSCAAGCKQAACACKCRKIVIRLEGVQWIWWGVWQGSLPGVLYTDCNEMPRHDIFVFGTAVHFFKEILLSAYPLYL